MHFRKRRTMLQEERGGTAQWKNAEAGARGESAPAADSFGALYDRFFQPVYRYILSRVRSVPEAEDLASQTFLTALEAFPRYRERGRAAAWLFTIARNKILDSARRKRPDPLPADEEDPVYATGSAGGRDAEFLLSLRMRIDSLPEEERELIRLRYVADLSFPEIAAVAGKREEAVKKSLYRLIGRLRRDLEDSHG
jgi:RNA polymerase sigma-70 factor (ECF subfamily)